jgi:hypothetical protein
MMNSSLVVPTFECDYIEEPRVRFCNGSTYDPKVGVSTFGPFSLSQPSRHPLTCRVGFVGTAECIENARQWISSCALGVSGDGEHPDFPGCSTERGFFVDLVFDSSMHVLVTQRDRSEIAQLKGEEPRFEAALSLLDSKLRLLSDLDAPPDYVVIALPDDFIEKVGVSDYIKNGEPIHRDLRRALKATAMKHRLVTQLIRERTVSGLGRVDHKSKCAWNFFTAMYFKIGGIPWSPLGLTPDTCFIGVSFFRPVGAKGRVQASVAQAFNGLGDCLVLRGEDFPWEPTEQDRSPHLDEAGAEKLMRQVLSTYRKETGIDPRRVVLHKSSRFSPGEATGFQSGLGSTRECDMVALSGSAPMRLLRAGDYPTLRGTHFRIGTLDHLYTTGFIPALNAFPHGHVPLPLQIADHRSGDSSTRQILEEILCLTKLNWNSADFAIRKPVTLWFSELVGDILRELPVGTEPRPNFKFYI